MRTLLLFISTLFCLQLFGQEQPARFIRLYEDNDGINALFKGQDWGYTNGTRIDYCWRPEKKPAGFLSHIPFFKDSQAIITKSRGLMQLMYAPKKTSLAVPEKSDYAYAGGLVAIHTIHVSNPVKEVNSRLEWIAGVMGPPSLARQSQMLIHRMIGDPEPKGWDYQLPTDLLLNLNAAIEKRFTGNHFTDLCGGAQVYAGTMQTGLSVSGTLRFRYNFSYYEGMAGECFGNKKKQVAILFSVKPVLDFSVYNALLDGGLLNKNSPVNDKNAAAGTSLTRNKLTSQLDCLLLVSWQRVSVSFSQKFISPEFKGYEKHKVGNLSLYIGF